MIEISTVALFKADLSAPPIDFFEGNAVVWVSPFNRHYRASS